LLLAKTPHSFTARVQQPLHAFAYVKAKTRKKVLAGFYSGHFYSCAIKMSAGRL